MAREPQQKPPPTNPTNPTLFTLRYVFAESSFQERQLWHLCMPVHSVILCENRKCAGSSAHARTHTHKHTNVRTSGLSLLLLVLGMLASVSLWSWFVKWKPKLHIVAVYPKRCYSVVKTLTTLVKGTKRAGALRSCSPHQLKLVYLWVQCLEHSGVNTWFSFKFVL